MKRLSVLLCGLLLVLGAAWPWAARAAETTKTFSSTDEAVAALAAAVKAHDRDALLSIFGPAIEEITNPDRVQATNELKAFAAALDETHRVVAQSNNQSLLEVGAGSWPFPIPLVQQDGRWHFDTEAGKEELLNRRIGRNELAVLKVMRVYVAAQREYASRDRDGDRVLEYAQRIASSPGTKDGLFWPPDLDGELSPLGPLVAQAQAEGYAIRSKVQPAAREPFHGYYFKIVAGQGRNAPGGKHRYVINGNMIAGFALVAWPAAYGESGIMTFVVNQQGRVYQKDLGCRTTKTAAAMSAYDPGHAWTISRE